MDTFSQVYLVKEIKKNKSNFEIPVIPAIPA